MEHAGSNVTLSISSTCLTLKLKDTQAVIFTYDMPRISFASGGDAVRIFNDFYLMYYILCSFFYIIEIDNNLFRTQ